MKNVKIIDIDAILDRVISHLKLKNDSELANFLDIKQQTVSSWRKRKTLDFVKIINACECDLNWLINGITIINISTISSYEKKIRERYLKIKSEYKISNSDICKKLNISACRLDSFENLNTPIDINIIKGFCAYFDINPIYLIFGKGTANRGFYNILSLVESTEKEHNNIFIENMLLKAKLEEKSLFIEQLLNREFGLKEANGVVATVKNY